MHRLGQRTADRPQQRRPRAARLLGEDCEQPSVEPRKLPPEPGVAEEQLARLAHRRRRHRPRLCGLQRGERCGHRGGRRQQVPPRHQLRPRQPRQRLVRRAEGQSGHVGGDEVQRSRARLRVRCGGQGAQRGGHVGGEVAPPRVGLAVGLGRLRIGFRRRLLPRLQARRGHLGHRRLCLGWRVCCPPRGGGVGGDGVGVGGVGGVGGGGGGGGRCGGGHWHAGYWRSGDGGRRRWRGWHLRGHLARISRLEVAERLEQAVGGSGERGGGRRGGELRGRVGHLAEEGEVGVERRRRQCVCGEAPPHAQGGGGLRRGLRSLRRCLCLCRHRRRSRGRRLRRRGLRLQRERCGAGAEGAEDERVRGGVEAAADELVGDGAARGGEQQQQRERVAARLLITGRRVGLEQRAERAQQARRARELRGERGRVVRQVAEQREGVGLRLRGEGALLEVRRLEQVAQPCGQPRPLPALQQVALEARGVALGQAILARRGRRGRRRRSAATLAAAPAARRAAQRRQHVGHRAGRGQVGERGGGGERGVQRREVGLVEAEPQQQRRVGVAAPAAHTLV